MEKLDEVKKSSLQEKRLFATAKSHRLCQKSSRVNQTRLGNQSPGQSRKALSQKGKAKG